MLTKTWGSSKSLICEKATVMEPILKWRELVHHNSKIVLLRDSQRTVGRPKVITLWEVVQIMRIYDYTHLSGEKTW